MCAPSGLRVTGIAGSSRPLAEVHDLALMDLDGVVYIGAAAVPHAVDALLAAASVGMPAAYITNNASRPAEIVAEHLRSFGLPVGVDDVLTSAQAAARVLAEDLPPGARVLAVGGEGLTVALADAGFHVVTSPDDAPVAVVMGFGPDVSWRHLAAATRAVRAGARFVATNLDLTVPTPDGPAPGNGLLVQAVAQASGVVPLTIGKPEPTMFRQVVEHRQARRPLVVGDRLDTDIEGGGRAGLPTLLVMTGVTEPLDLLRAPRGQRPTFLAADLRGLMTAHPVATALSGGWSCGSFIAVRRDNRVEVRADRGGGGPADPIDALRAACAAAWAPSDGSATTKATAVEWYPVDDVVGLDVRSTR